MTTRAKLAILICFAAVMLAAVFLKLPCVNGTSFYPWPWRKIDAWPVYVGMALASVPFFTAQFLRRRGWMRFAAIALLMVSCFAMKLGSVLRSDLTGLTLVQIIVENPDATSYYTDAISVSSTAIPLRDWLPLYPQMMSQLNLHSKSKPPGPLLYWLAWIKLMGVGHSTALWGGLVLGAIATLSIPATYWLLRQLLSRDDEAAFCGASFLAVCPGFILFFPMMDPTYIILSALLVGLWFIAIREDRWIASLLLGLVLTGSFLLTFNVLVIGAFMIALPFVWGPDRRQAMLALKHGAIAAIVCAAALVLLWLTIGYDVPGTFRAAWQNQHELLRQHAADRPYPLTIPFDLTDFAMGSGWISVPLVLFYFLQRQRARAEKMLAAAAIGQLVLVAALGLLQSETARVWNFMLPLLMIPIGLELKTWPANVRWVPYALMVIITAAICQNMKLIY